MQGGSHRNAAPATMVSTHLGGAQELLGDGHGAQGVHCAAAGVADDVDVANGHTQGLLRVDAGCSREGVGLGGGPRARLAGGAPAGKVLAKGWLWVGGAVQQVRGFVLVWHDAVKHSKRRANWDLNVPHAMSCHPCHEPTIHARDDKGLASGGHGLVTIGEGGDERRVCKLEIGEVGHGDAVSRRSGKREGGCGYGMFQQTHAAQRHLSGGEKKAAPLRVQSPNAGLITSGACTTQSPWLPQASPAR